MLTNVNSEEFFSKNYYGPRIKGKIVDKNNIVKSSEKKVIEFKNSFGETFLQECTVVHDEKGSYLVGNSVGFRGK